MYVNTTETTAPDGTFTATKVTAGADHWTRWDSTNGLDIVPLNFTDTYSVSIYMKTVGTSNINVGMDFGDSGNATFSVGQEWKRYSISNVHQNYGGSTKFIDIVFSFKRACSINVLNGTYSCLIKFTFSFPQC